MLTTILPKILSETASQTAKYYLDPGTGSYLLQILIATILGAIVFFRGFWARVFNSIKKLLFRSKPTNDEIVDDNSTKPNK